MGRAAAWDWGGGGAGMGTFVEALLPAVLRDEWDFDRGGGSAGGGPAGAEAWRAAGCAGRREMHAAPM